MELSEAEVRRIASFWRSAAKAPSMDSIVDGAFKTLKKITAVQSMQVVYPMGHAAYVWQTSEKGTTKEPFEEWPARPRKGFSVNFEPRSDQSGYATVFPRSPKAALALQALAPAIWTGLLLQSALERGRKAFRSEAEMARESLRARDQERRRIARELHDDLGQSMASLKLNLKWAEELVQKQRGTNEIVSELSSARESVGAMLGKIRDLSHTLYPRILDTLGLFAAVKELAVQVARYSTLKVTCTAKGKERQLEKEVGVALYRCCQESINNAVKHASATRLSIQLRYTEKEVHLTIEDDGRGFDPRTLYDSSGKIMSAGFWTIRQRMADLGGAFRLSTAGGQGTVVEMIVPYTTRENHGRRKNKTSHRG